MALIRSDLAGPLAVLIGAGLIAGVIWRGLDRIAETLQAATEVRIAPAFSGVGNAHEAAPLVAPVAPIPAAVSESAESRHNRLTEQAELAFARQRSDYVRACWKPSTPPPGQAPDFGGAFAIEIKFDASGLETSRAVLSGAYAQPPLLACVRATKLPALRIAAPGEPVTVTVHMPIP